MSTIVSIRTSPESRVKGRGSKGDARYAYTSPRRSSLVPRYTSSGFSLVEVIVAMGIAAFCLVAMIGLIPTGLKQVKISSEQTVATAILAAVASDIRNTPTGTANSLIYGVELPTIGGNFSSTDRIIYLNEDGSVGSRPTARYALQSSLASSNNVSSLVSGNIVIWWPAAAARGNAQGLVETIVSFNQR